MNLLSTETFSPPDRSARDLVGTYHQRRHYFEAPDGGGTIVAQLESGETIRGYIDDPSRLEPGSTYRFLGQWVEHHRHGWQFAFDVAVPWHPTTEHGVRRFLANKVPKVGAATASKLWNAYQGSAIDLLSHYPERVSDDGLMTWGAAQEASQFIRTNIARSNTLVRLHALLAGRGLPAQAFQRCVEIWGSRAVEVIQANPFELITEHVPGCGFLRVDKLFIELGHPPDAIERQIMCAWHQAAGNKQNDGNTWLPAKTLANAILSKISGTNVNPKEALREALQRGLLAKHHDGNQVWIADAVKARNEASIATEVSRLLDGVSHWPSMLPDELTAHQMQSAKQILGHPLCMLLGTPGTGKTFTAAAIIQELASRHGEGGIALCAPTGKAATRLTANLANRGLSLKATTIHSLLRGKPGSGSNWWFVHNERNRLPYPFILVDETSMCDTDLLAALLRACPPGANVLLIGDPYQLPPVGHGAPLRDLITAGVPHVELTEIQRNAGAIVRACAEIKAGKPFRVCPTVNVETGDNLRLLPARNTEEACNKVIATLRRIEELGQWDPLTEVQILVGTNNSRQRLNSKLQALFNPDGAGHKSHRFRHGDKVINLRNRQLSNVEGGAEYVANGDIGFVQESHPQHLIVEFTDPQRVVRVPLGKTDQGHGDDKNDQEEENSPNLALAYAITGHKFQGSEAPVVIVLVEPGVYKVLNREWIYTAISRARELCLLIGDRRTIDGYCHRVSLGVRKTFLVEQLQEVMP